MQQKQQISQENKQTKIQQQFIIKKSTDFFNKKSKHKIKSFKNKKYKSKYYLLKQQTSNIRYYHKIFNKSIVYLQNQHQKDSLEPAAFQITLLQKSFFLSLNFQKKIKKNKQICQQQIKLLNQQFINALQYIKQAHVSQVHIIYLNQAISTVLNLSLISHIKFTNLQKLVITFNSIYSIQALQLIQNTHYLTELDVSFNNIVSLSSLRKLSPNNTKNLRYLYLTNLQLLQQQEMFLKQLYSPILKSIELLNDFYSLRQYSISKRKQWVMMLQSSEISKLSFVGNDMINLKYLAQQFLKKKFINYQ